MENPGNAPFGIGEFDPEEVRNLDPVAILWEQLQQSADQAARYLVAARSAPNKAGQRALLKQIASEMRLGLQAASTLSRLKD